MRKIFGVCTLAITVFAVSAVASPRAEAMTFGSLTGLRAASHEANLVQSVDYYGYHQPYGYYQPYAYYPWYGYYRTVCRAWWEGVRVGDWSLHEMSGRADIITTDRTPWLPVSWFRSPRKGGGGERWRAWFDKLCNPVACEFIFSLSRSSVKKLPGATISVDPFNLPFSDLLTGAIQNEYCV